MLGIAQHELERMFARQQLKACLGLPCAEMKMALVLWDRLVGIEWFVHIDQQMMMAAIVKIVACMGDAHVPQTETTPEPAFDRGAVLRPDKVQNGILWRGLSLSVSGKRHGRQRRR